MKRIDRIAMFVLLTWALFCLAYFVGVLFGSYLLSASSAFLMWCVSFLSGFAAAFAVIFFRRLRAVCSWRGVILFSITFALIPIHIKTKAAFRACEVVWYHASASYREHRINVLTGGFEEGESVPQPEWPIIGERARIISDTLVVDFYLPLNRRDSTRAGFLYLEDSSLVDELSAERYTLSPIEGPWYFFIWVE